MTSTETAAGSTAATAPTEPYLAVVCVTHDSGAVIEGFLDSVPGGSHGHAVEVHVVDSGSADGTPDRVRRRTPHTVVHELDANRGYAAGINHAVHVLGGRSRPPAAVVVVNPDVRFGADTLGGLLAVLLRDRSVGVVAPRLVTPDGGLQLSLRHRPTVAATWAEAVVGGPVAHRLRLPTEVVRDRGTYDTETDVAWATGGLLAVSWECLCAVGDWDESYFLYEEEVDFCLRAADHGFAVRYTPDATAVRMVDAGRPAPWIRALMRSNRVRHLRRRGGRATAVAAGAGLLAGDLLRGLAGRPEARAGVWALTHRAGVAPILGRYRPATPIVPAQRGAGRVARTPVRRPHVLIIVENLSVPFDRRVWQQSTALVRHGFDVTVICPMGSTQDTEPDVTIDGVRILRYRLTAARGGPLGYVQEYGVALAHSARLALRAHRARPVDIVHACNPPDLLLLVGLPFRLLTGARLVFDHHDLVPELFESRFGAPRGPFYRMAVAFERGTFAVADGVISTNESYRRVALERGRTSPDRVAVVRSAPDLSRFTPEPADDRLRRGRRYLAAYLGVMGPQDGVDFALRALAHLRDDLGFDDLHVMMMGSGDAFDDMVALRDRLGLADVVEFTGRVSDRFVRTCLSTADVCLSPDPLNPLNDVSTMNKVVEYMAMSRPIVSFDLKEARVSAGDAAVYAPANDEHEFGRLVRELLLDEELRTAMGKIGHERVRDHLSWSRSEDALIRFYRSMYALPARVRGHDR